MASKFMNPTRDIGPTIAELHVGDDPSAWERLGFCINENRSLIGRTEVVFSDGPKGIHSWVLRNSMPSQFGPIPTTFTENPVPNPSIAHPNGSIGFHHVVLMVPAFDIGKTALSNAGVQVEQGRPFGSTEKAMLRSAPKMGDIELELIGPESEDRSRHWQLWGLVIAVDDIDETADFLGDLIGQVKPAVQPSRRIATVKKEAELGVAVAFLGPRECFE